MATENTIKSVFAHEFSRRQVIKDGGIAVALSFVPEILRKPAKIEAQTGLPVPEILKPSPDDVKLFQALMHIPQLDRKSGNKYFIDALSNLQPDDPKFFVDLTSYGLSVATGVDAEGQEIGAVPATGQVYTYFPLSQDSSGQPDPLSAAIGTDIQVGGDQYYSYTNTHMGLRLNSCGDIARRDPTLDPSRLSESDLIDALQIYFPLLPNTRAIGSYRRTPSGALVQTFENDTYQAIVFRAVSPQRSEVEFGSIIKKPRNN